MIIPIKKGGELLLNAKNIEQPSILLNGAVISPERKEDAFSFSLQSGDYLELLNKPVHE